MEQFGALLNGRTVPAVQTISFCWIIRTDSSTCPIPPGDPIEASRRGYHLDCGGTAEMIGPFTAPRVLGTRW